MTLLLNKNKDNNDLAVAENWATLIEPVFVMNKISRIDNGSKKRVAQLKKRVLSYIQKALDYYCLKKELDNLTEH